MQNVEIQLGEIISQLRKDGVTGVIYFVNPERGNDAFDGQSAEFPLLTVDAALALCVDYRHDAIICFTNNNTTIQFNAAGAGCIVGVAGVTIIGVGDIAMDNINGGATIILQLNDAHVKVRGIRFAASFAGTALDITANGDWADVYNNTFVSPNIGVACAGDACKLHHNNLMTHTGANPSWFNITGPNNLVYSNTMMGSGVANSVGISFGAAAHFGMAYDNIIEDVQIGVVVNIAANFVTVTDSRWRTYLTNQGLTVANGTNAVTLMAHYARGACGLQFHVNCAFPTGGNDSFKNHATPGSQLTIWVEEYTEQDANWRRITPDDGRYKIRTTDALDVLIASEIYTAARFRLMGQLDVAPIDTIDLDCTMIVSKEG